MNGDSAGDYSCITDLEEALQKANLVLSKIAFFDWEKAEWASGDSDDGDSLTHCCSTAQCYFCEATQWVDHFPVIVVADVEDHHLRELV